ncbi:Cation_efflux family protein [Hexamita inflata]|uniref:Cation efflux family protein n=1 Tax=Hexamita inflata TaxID=28002 RepID=A0AA86UE96_9EUKA|nr:Cation efflux family protein [Hexamita inflata]
MSILATAMDLLLEILSGIVLFISVRLAKLGIKQGEFQQAIHYNNPDNIKYIYAQRQKTELIDGFSQRRGLKFEDVISAMCSAGMDCSKMDCSKRRRE